MTVFIISKEGYVSMVQFWWMQLIEKMKIKRRHNIFIPSELINNRSKKHNAPKLLAIACLWNVIYDHALLDITGTHVGFANNKS